MTTIRIPLDAEDFAELISGKIITKVANQKDTEVQIALNDIGFSMMRKLIYLKAKEANETKPE